MIKKGTPGCGSSRCTCSSACGQICVTVEAPSGCGGSGAATPISGATVTVSLAGSTVGTCTTDSTGKCCVPITTAGTYTISATPPSGSTCLTASATYLSATCATNSVTIRLGLNSACACSYCCAYPLTTSLHVTTAAGTVALGSGSLGGLSSLYGCLSYSSSRIAQTTGYSTGSCAIAGIQLVSGSTRLYFELDCVGGSPNQWALYGGLWYRTGWTGIAADPPSGCHGINKDWGYLVDPGGTCSGPGGTGCSSDAYGNYCQVLLMASSLSVVTCADGSLLITGTFPSTYTDPTSGLVITVPFGGSVTCGT